MDIFLILLAGLFLLVGLLGSVLPVLPGTPLSYVGIFLLHLTDRVQFSSQFLVFWAVVVVAVQLFDYFVPIWGTKKEVWRIQAGRLGKFARLDSRIVCRALGNNTRSFCRSFARRIVRQQKQQRSFACCLWSVCWIFIGYYF